MIINEKFKGNWKDYLKYAVGEILLVVFGILIALQINMARIILLIIQKIK